MDARLLRNGLGLSVFEGCLAMLPITFTSGLFLTGFALVLGADTWALGLIMAIVAGGQLAQLAAPVLLARGAAVKPLTIWSASLGRYMWLAIAALPFLPLEPQARLVLFLVLLATSTALVQVSGTTWTDWMADMVPGESRGRYFGLRSAIAAVAGLAVTFFGTCLLDVAGHAPGAQARAFAGLLGLAALGALASQLALMRQPAPPPRPMATRPPLAALKAPFADRAFLRVAALLWSWTAVVWMTAPFVTAYALEELGYGYTTMGLSAAVMSGLSILSQPVWGRLIDRLGAQRTLALAIAPITLHPLYWLALTPERVWPLALDTISAGLFWPGVVLAAMALVIEAAPARDRAGYLAVMNAGSGLAGSLGSLLGAAAIAGLAALALPVPFGALQLLLVACFVLRLALTVAFWRAPRLTAAPTIEIVTRLAEAPPAPLAPDEGPADAAQSFEAGSGRR